MQVRPENPPEVSSTWTGISAVNSPFWLLLLGPGWEDTGQLHRVFHMCNGIPIRRGGKKRNITDVCVCVCVRERETETELLVLVLSRRIPFLLMKR